MSELWSNYLKGFNEMIIQKSLQVFEVTFKISYCVNLMCIKLIELELAQLAHTLTLSKSLSGSLTVWLELSSRWNSAVLIYILSELLEPNRPRSHPFQPKSTSLLTSWSCYWTAFACSKYKQYDKWRPMISCPVARPTLLNPNCLETYPIRVILTGVSPKQTDCIPFDQLDTRASDLRTITLRGPKSRW